MSEIDFENELIDNCIKIIEAETKPLSKKPSKSAVNTMAIDKLNGSLSMNKLLTQTEESYLEDMFKTL